MDQRAITNLLIYRLITEKKIATMW